MTIENTPLTVEAIVQVPIHVAWELWTHPSHIRQWNSASDDWHSPTAENDLRAGGRFVYRMEAKDGSAGFDFAGVYDSVEPLSSIRYTMEDGRKAMVSFTSMGNHTQITETFDAENMNSRELQQTGWQAILDHFKKYSESQPRV
jgi:uncharacterized protein YndB with AHSA1/START domain